MDDRSELLGFVFAVSNFCFIDSIQFIYQTARLHRILIKVEKGLIQGIGTIVGVGELL